METKTNLLNKDNNNYNIKFKIKQINKPFAIIVTYLDYFILKLTNL